MVLGIWLSTIIIGAYGESCFHRFGSDTQEPGTAKTELPPFGSVLHVESRFEGGTFVAVYAGQRFYYALSPAMVKAKVILEPGKAYEVISQKIQNGGQQAMLVPVVR